jgi:hypothetical protein
MTKRELLEQIESAPDDAVVFLLPFGSSPHFAAASSAQVTADGDGRPDATDEDGDVIGAGNILIFPW